MTTKAAKRKPKRSKAHVSPEQGISKGWVIYYYAAADPAGTPPGIEYVPKKANAIKTAVEWCKAWPPSQLFIHTADGKIADERSYGTDPPSIPGTKAGARVRGRWCGNE